VATVQVELPPKLVPVFTGPAMYRGAYGGRGSAKTRSFAKMAAVWGLRFAEAGERGVIVCGREFMNSLDDSSMAEVKAAILSEPWLAERYEVGEKFIRTSDGLIDFVFVGLRHNLDSIKSKALIRLLWVDEAEPVAESAWSKAINTVREEGSEVWVTWNPERKKSATHLRFRADPPAESRIVELNWRDNPWFPAVLEKKRLEDKAKRPDQYEHTWEGDFVTVVEGAYFAASLSAAKSEGRIGKVAKDPLMTLRAVWDIGGTGAKADACSIWIAQFVGREIRVLDYYEAQGQPLATHLSWLREKGYGKALCILPHDGATNDKVHDVSYASALTDASFEVKVVPNQGKGAAKMRIEAARRLFPSIWFNAATTEAGREALGWYHEKRSDDARNIGLGPEHDWSSHGADAFGLMCVAYEEPQQGKSTVDPLAALRGRSGSWMGR
jgi:phage terminase large subunit